LVVIRVVTMQLSKLAYARSVVRARLDGLEGILEGLRRLPELDEVKPGVFYVRRTPFLHFHTSSTARAADVREGDGWGERIPLPTGPVSKTATTKFIREVRRRLAVTIDG
jgi:hypothetical protein